MEAMVSPNSQIFPEERYSFHAYSAPVRLNLKQIREQFASELIERYSPDCLIYHRQHNQKIFIFRYGTVVFFNFPTERHHDYLTGIGVVPPPQLQPSEEAEDEITEEEFTLRVVPGTNEVGFNMVTVSQLDTPVLQLIAQLLAQSSALEIIEHEVEEFLAESERMTGFLKRSGWPFGKRQKLLAFIGEGLSAKHRIINQLAILWDPETTWEKEDLYFIYRRLFAALDIKERIEKIEKMLNLCAEVSDMLLETLNTRRAEILELVIIALIALEIIRAF